MAIQLEDIIEVEGDTWRIIGLGITRDDGARIVHIASKTRFRQQRNGKVAVQLTGWLTPSGTLEQA